MGTHNLADRSYVNRKKVKADHHIIHTGYKDGEIPMLNDIALIKLSTTATINKDVQIASLAEKDDDFLGGKCVVAGWGITSTGKTPRRLKEVSVNYVKMEFISPILLKTGKC